MMERYFRDQTHLETMYGDKSVVLYQCGGFYEAYVEAECACVAPEMGKGRLCGRCKCVRGGESVRGKAGVIQSIWNVAMPKKGRWFMVGFPSDNPGAYERHIRTLVHAKWTVSVYKQVDGGADGRLGTAQEKTRVHLRTYSQGTFSTGESRGGSTDTITMALFMRETTIHLTGSDVYEVGVAIMNLTTMKLECGEVYSKTDDINWPFAKIRTLLCQYEPSEFLVVSRSPDTALALLSKNGVAIPPSKCIVRPPTARLRLVCNRNAVFEKTFPGVQGAISIDQHIGISRKELTSLALAELILFIDAHDPQLLTNVALPSPIDDKDTLVLHTTTLQQLNVIPCGSQDCGGSPETLTSLLGVVDQCVTAGGSALLRERLCRPCFDGGEIGARHDKIDAIRPFSNQIRKRLRGLESLTRITTKLRSKRFTYANIATLHETLQVALEMYDVLCKVQSKSPRMLRWLSASMDKETVGLLRECLETIEGTFLLSEMSRVSSADILRVSCFRPGTDDAVDSVMKDAAAVLSYMNEVRRSLHRVLPPVRVGNRKKPVPVPADALAFVTTTTNRRSAFKYELNSKAWKAIRMKASGIAGVVALPPCLRPLMDADPPVAYPDNDGTRVHPPSWGDPFTSHTSGGKHYVAFAWQTRLVDRLHDCHRELLAGTKARLARFVEATNDRYGSALSTLCEFVAELDITVSSATIADMYAYVRPTILSSGDATLRIDGLRHPVIERLDNSTAYTCNDICFDTTRRGYLVYGVNAAGKSSFMKAIGLAVIMAQAGLFVPASQMTLRPYRNLFTRINKKDDIFRGLSSFQVEMLEVAGIIKRCGPHSLVIGDELCSGTETTSAISIMGASINHMIQREGHFLFATHLHELTKIPCIQHDALKIVHMEATVDGACLVYTRKLREGSGPDTYGINACVGIGVPESFIKEAREVRKALLNPNNESLLKSSQYNPKVLFGAGTRCSVEGCESPAAEVHHIVHQADAVDGWLHDGRHKNDRSNLLPVCKHHHNWFHSASPPTATWRSTSHGVRVEIKTQPS